MTSLRIALVLLSIIEPRIYAQTSAGAIVGVVRDSSGSVIPQAKVVVANLGTNVSSPFETDGTGNYYVPALIPGHYKVEAAKPGFKTVTVSDVELAVSQTLRVDLTMPVGQLAESVSVEAEGSLIQADQATIGQVVNNRSVSELPLNLGTLGNTGRNTLLSTGQRAGDVSFFKIFRLREQAQLQFRSAFFNLLSSHFYSPRFPNSSILATNFGSLLPVGGDDGDLFSPRIIQFVLRLIF